MVTSPLVVASSNPIPLSLKRVELPVPKLRPPRALRVLLNVETPVTCNLPRTSNVLRGFSLLIPTFPSASI